MKYALVILEPLVPSDEQGQALRNCANSFEGKEGQNRTAVRLNTGAYLIPLEHGMRSVMNLTEEALSRRMRVHTLFFDEAPKWITTAPQ